jgi:hypothetical protein
MTEILSKFDSGEFIGLVAVVGGLLCGLTAIVMGCWLEIRKVALKQDLVDRGMSAEDIQTVLNAGTHRSKWGCHSRHSCGA